MIIFNRVEKELSVFATDLIGNKTNKDILQTKKIDAVRIGKWA